MDAVGQLSALTPPSSAYRTSLWTLWPRPRNLEYHKRYLDLNTISIWSSSSTVHEIERRFVECGFFKQGH